MIAIVDTGGANITSVVNAFARLGIESALTRDHETIAAAPHVILPGVGAAADSMRRLRDGQLVELICGLTQPVLGICLGMQLLFDRSLEGDTQCLGILPGAVEKIPGFYAIVGFVAFVLIVRGGQALRLLIKRDEDYYDE